MNKAKRNLLLLLLVATIAYVKNEKILNKLHISLQKVLDKIKNHAQLQIEKHLEKVLDAAAARIRTRIKDDQMPTFVKRAVDGLTDTLLPEFKQECWRWTDERFLPAPGIPQRSTALSPLSPRSSSPPFVRVESVFVKAPSLVRENSLMQIFRLFRSLVADSHTSLILNLRRARAFVLYSLWPYDRTIWSSIRRPGWWILQMIGLLPMIGPIWWLLLSAAVDKGDEYQLCAFIVGLRVSHFVSLGLGAAAYGCIQAFRCAIRGVGGFSCASLHPQLSPWGGAFWLVQVLIMLRAVSLLPHSHKKGSRIALERRGRLTTNSRLALVAGEKVAPPLSEAVEPGGVLWRLSRLDRWFTFAAIVAAVFAALFIQPGEPIRASLFWIRTTHGLLSCPYCLFKLPLLDTLLTHARRTGYDQLGHTVPYRPKMKL